MRLLRVCALTLAGATAWGTALPQAQAGAVKPAPAPAIERLTVQSDGHPMAVWARKPATPKGTILLVHGRTWSARPDFDLQVPGLQRSVMLSLVAQGFAAYAVDLRGYGETPRDRTGWLTPLRAAQDVVNVMTWVAAQHPTLPKPALVGWSRGAAVSAMAAQFQPSRVSAVVLFGFVFDPDLEFVDSTSPEKPQFAKNTEESAASDFVSPKVTPPAVIQAFIEQAMKADPVLMDLKNDAEFNALKPAKLTTPTLILYGERDAGVVPEDAGKFFAKVAATEKQIVQLPGSDHAAHIEDTHDAWISAIVNFLNRPGVKR